MKETIIEKIRKLIKEKRFEWRKHALQRLMERNISQIEVFHAVENGEIIREYPEDKPFPSYLLSGKGIKDQLHIVISLDFEKEWVYIITVYKPDLNHFEENFKTRKKK